MTGPDDVMRRVGEGIAAAQQGDRALSRSILAQVWDDIGGGSGDPFFRCAVAHSIADVQDDLHDELAWDLEALAAARLLTDERVRAGGAGDTARSFLPSLHLNLADVHRRLGDTDRAREHVAEGRAALAALADDGYAQMIREGFERIAAEIAR